MHELLNPYKEEMEKYLEKHFIFETDREWINRVLKSKVDYGVFSEFDWKTKSTLSTLINNYFQQSDKGRAAVYYLLLHDFMTFNVRYVEPTNNKIGESTLLFTRTIKSRWVLFMYKHGKDLI